MDECIRDCMDCHRECQETLFQKCLPSGGQHVESDHVRLMSDCIAICELAADAMMRDSRWATQICSLCAEICQACAESCERIDSYEMKSCAEACRRCAQSCESMSQLKHAA